MFSSEGEKRENSVLSMMNAHWVNVTQSRGAIMLLMYITIKTCVFLSLVHLYSRKESMRYRL